MGLCMGLIVEGVARKGLTIWQPSHKLTFYWSQTRICVEDVEPEDEEEEDEVTELTKLNKYTNGIKVHVI